MSGPRFFLVCFDVDSTLVTIEGVDVLAAGNPEIARLTEGAMNGTISLDEVYERRLEIVRPTAEAIRRLSETYRTSLTPGARETITELRRMGCDIHLVSAGIEQAILPLAQDLGIAPRAVHAVRLRFDDEGNYVDFDRTTPLTRPGGKETVVLDLRARRHGRAAFVGDGVTDAEVRDVVDLFVGFGGVIARPAVRERAHVFVDGPSLADVLPFLKGDA